MSSACVCHIEGEWCFYCEVFLPVEKENERLKSEVTKLRAELKAESLRAAEWEGEALGYAEENERLRNLLKLIYHRARTDAVRRGGGQHYARRLVRELGSIISPEVVE